MISLLLGDCLEKMKELDDNSVDSVVCDPPYGLSFMGKKWDYDVPSVEIWEECLRVLKPGGHLLSFSGTRTQHRMAVRIEDAGFEIRDMIAWVYGSGMPKSLNVSKSIKKVTDDYEVINKWEGWGTNLKPSLEPITVARKPLIGTVVENVLTYGTGAINIDGCRIEFSKEPDKRVGIKDVQKGASGNPFSTAQNDGTISTYKEGGRWPANLIHDGSDDVVELFPVDAKVPSGVVKVSSGRKSGEGTWVGTGMHRPGAENTGVRDFGDAGSAARFFYCAKASKKDRNEGYEGLTPHFAPTMGNGIGGKEHDPQTATPKHNTHPTVKPTELMRYLCRLVTPPGGIVLDPFMGSGSTGKAALLEGFSFIGIEMDEAYFQIANKRINAVKNKPSLENYFE